MFSPVRSFGNSIRDLLRPQAFFATPFVSGNALRIRARTLDGDLKECSHTRMTRHPRARSAADTTRSLARLRPILAVQYTELLAGIRQCFGQPCQKQPSTKTARRSLRKPKSGEPGNGSCRRQPVMPFSRKIAASRNSVSRFPRDRIFDITSDRSDLESMSPIYARMPQASNPPSRERSSP